MCCFHGYTLITCISYQIDVDVLYILYVETFVCVYIYIDIYTLFDIHVNKNNTSTYPAVVRESSCTRPCSNLAFFSSLLWVSWHGVGGMDWIQPEEQLRRQILDQLKLEIAM